jgi:two-component system sensor histidine kinase BaeS
MSHDLRTPLSTLRGQIEALVDQVRSLTPAAVLSLRDDVLRLGRLVDDLHLLAMADLHTLPCHMATTDAVEMVNHALQRYARRAELAGLTQAWGTTPPPTLPVVWDEARMDQVLTNVFEKSLRYTDKPGRIEVTQKETAGRVALSVPDSAPGVPAEDLSRLFEPLYRADAARSRHTGASGLGLAIAQAIAQAHQGLLSARQGPLGGIQITLNVATNAQIYLP